MDLTINAFNFNNYLENNPIAQECVNSWKRVMPNAKIKIWTLDDVMDIVNKYKFSKLAYENNLGSYIGDTVRVHLATNTETFLYMDLDTFLLKDLTPLCEQYENFCVSFVKYDTEKKEFMPFINNGAIFWSTNYGKGAWQYLLDEYIKAENEINCKEQVYANDVCSFTKKMFKKNSSIYKDSYFLNCKLFSSKSPENLYNSYICHAGLSACLFRLDSIKYKNNNDYIYYTELPRKEFEDCYYSMQKLISLVELKNLFLISDNNGYISEKNNIELRNVIFPDSMSTFEKRKLFEEQIYKIYNKKPIYIPVDFFLENKPTINFHVQKKILMQKDFLSTKYFNSNYFVDCSLNIEKIYIKIKNNRTVDGSSYNLVDKSVIDIYLPNNTIIYDDIHTIVNEYFKLNGNVRTFDLSKMTKINNVTFNIVCCNKDLDNCEHLLNLLNITDNTVNVYYNEDKNNIILKNKINSLKNVTYYHDKKVSVYEARKFLVNKTTAKYTLFLDPDDYFIPSDIINKYLESNKDIIIFNYIDTQYREQIPSKYKTLTWSGLWNKIIKTECLINVYNYFDNIPQIFEDKVVYLTSIFNNKNSVYFADSYEMPNYIYHYKKKNINDNIELFDETLSIINNIDNDELKKYLNFEISTSILETFNDIMLERAFLKKGCYNNYDNNRNELIKNLLNDFNFKSDDNFIRNFINMIDINKNKNKNKVFNILNILTKYNDEKEIFFIILKEMCKYSTKDNDFITNVYRYIYNVKCCNIIEKYPNFIETYLLKDKYINEFKINIF